jgi:NAD(P)-dependent dehydrogenase (short-subunit alcohol dehydrogenase family)
VEALGRKAEARQVDIASEAAIHAEMDRIVEIHGRIDAVFANAAAYKPPKPFVDQDRAFWDDVFATNVWSTRATLQAAAQRMIARAKAGEPGGSLVAVASLAGLNAAPYIESCGVSKAAILSLSKHVAGSLARYGIRSNAIVPGWIETDMTVDMRGVPQVQQSVGARIPMRRWGKPDDFAAIAVYLASDGSRYHTADTFVIDGGYLVSMA